MRLGVEENRRNITEFGKIPSLLYALLGVLIVRTAVRCEIPNKIVFGTRRSTNKKISFFITLQSQP